jgi:polyisoprenoid-binding protein YceI
MLFAAFCTSPAMAGEWRIDDNHSQAVFTIEHIVGKVTGFFNSFRFGDRDMQSTVRFDPDSPENGACEIVINTWTIDTGIERRDKHLSTSDFFDCRNFPVIVFKSDDISRLDDGTYEAAGKLTIKDVTKSVVVPFTFLGSETHPDPNMKKNKGAIEARINLNRLDYNVGSGKFSKMGLVGEGVCLTVYLEMFAE